MEVYTLNITTSSRYNLAGTNKTVQAKIVGDNGNETAWQTLDYFWENDFEMGAVRDYEIRPDGQQKIGVPIALMLRVTGFSFDNEWLCDKVIITYEGKKYNFPVYRWLKEGMEIAALGKGYLPQSITNEHLKKLISDEIAANKEAFKWNPKPTPTDLGWGINRYLDDTVPLPLVYLNTVGMETRTGESTFTMALNKGVLLFKGAGEIDDLSDYTRIYEGSGLADPPFLDVWKTDKEFGRQVLTGISPLAMERCKSIPSYFNVTNSTVSAQLGAGKTLEAEMKAGKIFIADYAWTKQISRSAHGITGKTFYSADCIGLFHSTESGEFLPLAIQLVPNESDSVFTPADSEYDWLLAKMYFRCVWASCHEWYAHWMMTHAMAETFSVATFRNLPHCHPIYKLLRPHLKFVANINRQARKVLLPAGSLASKSVVLNAVETVRYYFKNFKLSDLDIPKRIGSQGMAEPDSPSNYYYRNDALQVWAALNSYVTNVVEYFYKADSDVAGDYELQAWASDLANEGFGYEDGNTRGMPENITTRSELIRICNIMIFSSSAQHSAVNFGQMETYQFVPNAPTSMRLPPHKRGEADLKRVLQSLPDVITASFMLILAYALSQYSKDEVFLGDVSEELFVEDEVKAMQANFKTEMDDLNSKFQMRNASLKLPYEYLLPTKIPSNINI